MFPYWGYSYFHSGTTNREEIGPLSRGVRQASTSSLFLLKTRALSSLQGANMRSRMIKPWSPFCMQPTATLKSLRTRKTLFQNACLVISGTSSGAGQRKGSAMASVNAMARYGHGDGLFLLWRVSWNVSFEFHDPNYQLVSKGVFSVKPLNFYGLVSPRTKWPANLKDEPLCYHGIARTAVVSNAWFRLWLWFFLGAVVGPFVTRFFGSLCRQRNSSELMAVSYCWKNECNLFIAFLDLNNVWVLI